MPQPAGVFFQCDIDHHSAARLRSEIDRLLCTERPKRLWLNLSAVEFMDSSGLGLILGRCNLLGELGGEMILRAPAPRVEKILRLAGLERLIPIEAGKKNQADGSY